MTAHLNSCKMPSELAKPAMAVKTEPRGGGASSVASPVANQQPAKTKRAKITDFGLAQKLEESKLVREVMRSGTHELIQWPTKETINVISLNALGLNSEVMCIVADYHCSRLNVIKPPNINFLKAQVGSS